jgi:hypothetical protein
LQGEREGCGRGAKSGATRDADWQTIVFLDRSSKWVLHAELEWLLNELSESSASVVYQPRPRLVWSDLFAILAPRLSSYTAHAAAVHDATVAFVLMARSSATFDRLSTAGRAYAKGHAQVKYATILGAE